VDGWIAEFERAVLRLSGAAERLFVLPFGGAIGAMHAFGDRGRLLNQKLAQELKLAEMLVPSRTMNDVFVEYLLQLSLLAMFVERVMIEAYTLMGGDFGELSENLGEDAVGSSTMPQKVNPKYVIPVAAQAGQLKSYATTALESGRASHEGDPLANQILSSVINNAVPLAWTMANDFSSALTRLVVQREVMKKNLMSVGASVTTEKLMMNLAPLVGRGKAHDIVHHALETGGPSALKKDPNILKHFSVKEIEETLDPTNYLGDSVEIAIKASNRARALAKKLMD